MMSMDLGKGEVKCFLYNLYGFSRGCGRSGVEKIFKLSHSDRFSTILLPVIQQPALSGVCHISLGKALLLFFVSKKYYCRKANR